MMHAVHIAYQNEPDFRIVDEDIDIESFSNDTLDKMYQYIFAGKIICPIKHFNVNDSDSKQIKGEGTPLLPTKLNQVAGINRRLDPTVDVNFVVKLNTDGNFVVQLPASGDQRTTLFFSKEIWGDFFTMVSGKSLIPSISFISCIHKSWFEYEKLSRSTMKLTGIAEFSRAKRAFQLNGNDIFTFQLPPKNDDQRNSLILSNEASSKFLYMSNKLIKETTADKTMNIQKDVDLLAEMFANDWFESSSMVTSTIYEPSLMDISCDHESSIKDVSMNERSNVDSLVDLFSNC